MAVVNSYVKLPEAPMKVARKSQDFFGEQGPPLDSSAEASSTRECEVGILLSPSKDDLGCWGRQFLDEMLHFQMFSPTMRMSSWDVWMGWYTIYQWIEWDMKTCGWNNITPKEHQNRRPDSNKFPPVLLGLPWRKTRKRNKAGLPSPKISTS